jgi:hypothetical protein
VIKSQEELMLFWEVLHFRRGIPLPISNTSAIKLDPEEIAPVYPRMQDAQTRFGLCNAIVMPHDQVFMRTANRLLVWLWLANKARHTIDTPDGNADAIRNYYMIWEDLYGIPDVKTTPKEAFELKLIRDLVSHGYKLGNKELRKLTMNQYGRAINQFDPTDRVHQCLVGQYRTIGRELVERELDQKIL